MGLWNRVRAVAVIAVERSPLALGRRGNRLPPYPALIRRLPWIRQDVLLGPAKCVTLSFVLEHDEHFLELAGRHRCFDFSLH